MSEIDEKLLSAFARKRLLKKTIKHAVAQRNLIQQEAIQADYIGEDLPINAPADAPAYLPHPAQAYRGVVFRRFNANAVLNPNVGLENVEDVGE